MVAKYWGGGVFFYISSFVLFRVFDYVFLKVKCDMFTLEYFNTVRLQDLGTYMNRFKLSSFAHLLLTVLFPQLVQLVQALIKPI